MYCGMSVASGSRAGAGRRPLSRRRTAYREIDTTPTNSRPGSGRPPPGARPGPTGWAAVAPAPAAAPCRAGSARRPRRRRPPPPARRTARRSRASAGGWAPAWIMPAIQSGDLSGRRSLCRRVGRSANGRGVVPRPFRDLRPLARRSGPASHQLLRRGGAEHVHAQRVVARAIRLGSASLPANRLAVGVEERSVAVEVVVRAVRLSAATRGNVTVRAQDRLGLDAVPGSSRPAVDLVDASGSRITLRARRAGVTLRTLSALLTGSASLAGGAGLTRSAVLAVNAVTAGSATLTGGTGGADVTLDTV